MNSKKRKIKLNTKNYLLGMVISMLAMMIVFWLLSDSSISYFLADSKRLTFMLALAFGFSLFLVPLAIFTVSNWQNNQELSTKEKVAIFIGTFVIVLLISFGFDFLWGDGLTWRTIVVDIILALGMSVYF